MAITNQERVGKAMELLRQGLGPYVAREFENAQRDMAQAEARRLLPAEDRINGIARSRSGMLRLCSR